MSFSLLIRRTHMYLALFLFPWLLMSAVSTAVTNHGALFVDESGGGAPQFERELVYEAYSRTMPSSGRSHARSWRR